MTIYIIIAIFGLIIGSFLNVCIYRIPRDLSVIKPARSFCPSCNAQLSWFENIPVLSWLVLRAKCRHCQVSISGRYPFVEILSAIAAVASFIRYQGLTPTALVIYALSATLIVITFIDVDFKRIPNVITFPGITLGLCLGILSQFTDIFQEPVTQNAMDSLTGLLLGGGVLYAISLLYYGVTKRVGLGGGDIKLLAMTGALLGWESAFPTIFAGSLAGAVIGIFLMLFKGSSRQAEIPFGPWLALGVVLYMFADIPLFRL